MERFNESDIFISDECINQQINPILTTPQETAHPLFILFAIPATIIILLTIFGNLLVLCFKAKVGRTNTTLLVWNLGLTDFLVGVFVLPLGAIHLITRKWLFGRLLCRFWVAVDVTFCTCSVVTICIISVDRYLAVTRPLRYKSVVTKCKVILVMIVIWIFSSSILLTTVRWHQPNCMDESICFAGNEIRYLAHSVVFAFFLPASVTLTLYWRIYKLARNRQRALDRGFLIILGHNMNFLTNTISQSTALRVHLGRNNGMVEHQRRVLRTHERIAKTLGVVSCSFLFCWLPFFALYLTNYHCRGCVAPVILDIASWLGYCNSMLNPIIYSFTVKEFKRSAQRAILPVWKVLHNILPACIKAPPEHAGARMSRTGHRPKPRTKSFEICRTQKAMMPVRIPTKRRQSEPAVFAVTRVNRKTYAGDGEMEKIEEENYEEAQEYSISSERIRREMNNGNTLTSTIPVLEPLIKNGTIKESQNGGTNWFKRSKKWICRTASFKGTKSNKLTSKSVPSFQIENGIIKNAAISGEFSSIGPNGPESAPVTTTCNGLVPSEKSSTGSHCSIRVYCVTQEADV